MASVDKVLGEKPTVKSFFDSDTNTLTHLVWCAQTKSAAIVDSVMHYEAASGNTSTELADEVASFAISEDLKIAYHIETHVHADHLSAAPYLRHKLGGKVVIGSDVPEVQRTFKPIFNFEPEFDTSGNQFDLLIADGESFQLGNLSGKAIATPGHTPACTSWLIGDALFVGDTLFAPDFGTARCDFPGGDARTLYQSVQKLYELPDETRVFLCHDYMPNGRAVMIETTIGAQKSDNIQIAAHISESEFVEMREARDAKLRMPTLILPSVQVNLRAGELPPAEDNGVHYIKVPINQFQ